MAFDMQNCAYDPETGLPLNREYLERGLPPYLQTSIKRMCDSWFIEDSGQKDYHWDIAWCELNADINAAETEQEISSEQAWYLREKYLRMKRNDEMCKKTILKERKERILDFSFQKLLNRAHSKPAQP